MASKADIPSKTDFMKHSVFNFIESEKAHGEIQNRSQNLGKDTFFVPSRMGI